MKKTVWSNNRGIALLITISIITVLIAGVLEWNRKVRTSVVVSATARDRVTLSYMAASGVHAAMAMLIKDRTDSDPDSLQEDWANPEKIDEAIRQIPFENGAVTFKITDERSKIQINALVQFPEGQQFNEAQRELWDRFLRLLPAPDSYQEDTDPNAIINSIKDWLDSGDDEAITGLSGAESGYYQGLQPPYPCRNGPFYHLGELALVKGVTTDLLNGAGGIPGISQYVTVHGITSTEEKKITFEGKININTAELPVLTALLPADSGEIAQAIYDYRLETNDQAYIHDLSRPDWYQNVPGAGGIQIDPDLITTQSDIFRIDADASLQDMKIRVTAVVEREKDKKTGRWVCSVLNWQTK
ncbi:MAG: general secretion pathway protein GspK [Desulfobacterales bacterium]|nr:general secretion pathway protein GspK [Desulfobacterales bacterium]